MPTLFDFAKPVLEKAGAVMGRDWQETRDATYQQAKAQLRRSNIKAKTVAKWHRLGFITATAAPPRTR